MMNRNFSFILLSALILLGACQSPSREHINCQVLVIGGGASGVSAAIAAARGGAHTFLVSEEPWLGGMLTSAGVSATDGNHRLPSGLWGEFRSALYEVYGGADAVFTGWVSNTQFEPHVGDSIWKAIAQREPKLTILYGHRFKDVLKEGKTVKGASFLREDGTGVNIAATISIDATELGDALAKAGAAFHTGVDDPDNPQNDFIQDITYAAILKDYGEGKDMTIQKPDEYDPSAFECICKTVCPEPDSVQYDCETVLNYALLPGKKYMINWPHNGNDYFVNPIPLTEQERQNAYEHAKNKTLGLVYFLQTEAGYKHLGLADDEFPTEDKLPIIPYHRESRRIIGMERLRVDDIIDPYANPNRPLYQTAIAVGDYPLDHHHKENENVPVETYPPIPSFSIPFGTLVPEDIEGLLVAEKSISVSHMVNGCSRLQPCVILIGQAAGTAAAICSKEQIQAWELNIRDLQQQLLNEGCWLMPFLDTTPEDPYFQSIQKMGVTGVIKGHGVPYQWANQTWIYPDSSLTPDVLSNALQTLEFDLETSELSNPVKRGELIKLLGTIQSIPDHELNQNWEDVDGELLAIVSYWSQNTWFKSWIDGKLIEPQKTVTRKELAFLLDHLLHPFEGREGAL